MRLPALRLRPSTFFYLVMGLVASAPAWIVKHPPLEDLPFHLATIRTLRSFHDPAFGFDQHFMLTLGRTQYVIYYVVGAALATVLGVQAANVVLMSAYLGGTVLALRALLLALGRDPRLSILVVPLLYNEMFVYGLFPFLLGIPLMLWALSIAVSHFERSTLRTGALLCVLALSLFYSHIFPFGIFCIGFVAMFPWTRPRRWLTSGGPMVPAALVLVWWSRFTDAGRLASGAALDNKADARRSLDAAIVDLPNWFTNILRDNTDEIALIALALVVVLALGLSLGDRDTGKAVARPYTLLPLACIPLYFILPESHGYIWMIAQRFPILFAITGIPLLRMPRGVRGLLVSAAAVAVSVFASLNMCMHFLRFELGEVGDIEGAIASIPFNQKVCALIYDKESAIVNNVPFLHYGSYYQAEKGGVVMFTFAGYAHWPVDFLPGKYPPPGTPARTRWEWTPERIAMAEIYPYYDYVLTRGQGFRPASGTYRVAFRDAHWTVFARN